MHDKLIKLLEKARWQESFDAVFSSIDDILDMPKGREYIVDYLLKNGVIVSPYKVGDEVWVINREPGEDADISCIMFLAKSKGCIIGTSWINDYDLDGTLLYHIHETQENYNTELMVYPDEDCFSTKEEAEQALKGGIENEH